MRFKDYLNESDKPSVDDVPEEMFRSWCLRHASNYIKNVLSEDNAIFRGVPSTTEYLIGDSTKFKRKAAYTRNYVNSFIATSPRWEKFPSRESAYICADNYRIAKEYARSHDPYLVIPADDAHIGVCPEEDFWPSFYSGFDKAWMSDVDSVFNLNQALYSLSDEHMIDLPETDSEMLHRQLTRMTAELLSKGGDVSQRFGETMVRMEVDNLNDLLEIILGPELNKFSQSKASAYFKRPNDREVWVSGKVAFMKINGSMAEQIEKLKNAV